MNQNIHSNIISCTKGKYIYIYIYILTTRFYLNVWFLSVFVIYLNLNTSIIFIKKENNFCTEKKIQNYFFQKNVKKVILSLMYKRGKNTKLIFQKKKKKPTTTHKNYSFLFQNFYGFSFNSLKHSKIFDIQILYNYHKSPSIHTNV